MLCLILGISLLLDVAHAATYAIPTPEPASYEDIETVVDDDIPAHLDTAMCGGWNKAESIGPSAAGGDLDINSGDALTLIPFVDGAPGRRGIWDGAPENAMALRDDTFVYPDTATGRSTVCEEGADEVTRRVWVDPVTMVDPGRPPSDPLDPASQCPPAIQTFLDDFSACIIASEAVCGDITDAIDQWCDAYGGGIPQATAPAGMAINQACADQGALCQIQYANDRKGVMANCTTAEELALVSALIPEWCQDPRGGAQGLPGIDGGGDPGEEPHVIVTEPGHYKDVTLSVADDEYPYFEGNPPCHWDENGESSDPWTPGQCQNFCRWINEYTYDDCRDFEDVTDFDGTVLDVKCAVDGWQPKYACSEDWVNPRNGDALPNCRECTGEECRCPRPDDDAGTDDCPYVPDVTEAVAPDPQAGRSGKEYVSFFRQYHVSVQRNTLEDVPNDKLASFEAETACYAYYDEFDPKDERTDGRYQCVIAFPYTAEELAESQAGKGDYLPDVTDQDPVIRNPDFNAGTDTWYPNLGGGMSFVSEPVFRNYYNRDFASAFLDLDDAAMETTYQWTDEEPEATGGYIRPPDETGLQTFTRWWNTFLADAAVIISPPTIRLRIAPALAPILSGLPVEGGTRVIRNGSVEAQLKVREDMLDTISDSLRRFLLLKPEPIPVVVPVAPGASSVEESRAVFLSLAERWQDYNVQRAVLGYPPAPGVDDLIIKLQQYAWQIDQYRALRSELPNYLSWLLTRQRDIVLGIHEWTQNSLERYRAYVASRNARLALAQDVRDLQTLHATFRDRTSLPWCHMEQFTTPIYSLLDPWLPNRPELDGGEQECESEDGLPALCLPDDQDFILDLTAFKMDPYGMVAPVPDVLFLRLDILPPPPAGDPPLATNAIAVPALPAVPTFSADALDLMPLVDHRNSPEGVPDPPAFDETDTREKLERAATVLNTMNDRYERFWTSADKSDATDALECEAWDSGVCAYAEPELIQIFTRLASRPFVLTRDDFDLLNVKEDEPCDPADEACVRMRSEKQMPRDGWQIVAPSDNSDAESALIEGLRRGMREQVIGPDGQVTTDADGTPLFRTQAEKLYPLFQQSPMSPLSPDTP